MVRLALPCQEARKVDWARLGVGGDVLTDHISQPRKPKPERQESGDLGEIRAGQGVALPMPFSEEEAGDPSSHTPWL